MVVFDLKAADLGCSTLHRARWLDVHKEDVTEKATFSYPRSPACQVLGRANLPGQAVFYTCGNAENSVHEARSGRWPSADLFRSQWTFADDRPWKMMSMVPPSNLYKAEPQVFAAWQEAMRDHALRGHGITADHLVKLYECITDLFLSDQYEITAVIAHKIMQEYKAADLLIYPSLASHKEDLCHAFRTAPIDQGRVELLRVEHMVPTGRKLRTIREGVGVGERIHWTKDRPDKGCVSMIPR